MRSYALVDTTSTILPGDLAHMVEAANKLAASLTDAWDLAPISGSVFSNDDLTQNRIPNVDVQFRFVADDTNVPGALGFHDEQSGVPYAELMINPVLQNGGGVLTGGGTTLASVFFHELAETACDEYASSWILMPSGKFIALEVADPVQGNLVAVTCRDGTIVQLSDFVHPRYFDAQATSTFSNPIQLSHLGTIAVPFSMTSGGYQIIFDPSNSANPISNVFGETVPQWKRDLKEKAGRARMRRTLGKGILPKPITKSIAQPATEPIALPPTDETDISPAARMFMTDEEASDAKR